MAATSPASTTCLCERRAVTTWSPSGVGAARSTPAAATRVRERRSGCARSNAAPARHGTSGDRRAETTSRHALKALPSRSSDLRRDCGRGPSQRWKPGSAGHSARNQRADGADGDGHSLARADVPRMLAGVPEIRTRSSLERNLLLEHESMDLVISLRPAVTRSTNHERPMDQPADCPDSTDRQDVVSSWRVFADCRAASG